MDNLLPAAQDSFFRYSCQQLYSEIYSKRIRELYLTLCWLENFSPLFSETINLKLRNNIPCPFPDFFKDNKIRWSDPKSENSKIVEELSNSNNWRDILPSELILTITWKEIGSSVKKERWSGSHINMVINLLMQNDFLLKRWNAGSRLETLTFYCEIK